MNGDESQALQEIRDNVRDIKTSLFGVPGTEDKGFVGETKRSLASQGSRIGSLEKYRWIFAGVVLLLMFLAETAAKVFRR